MDINRARELISPKMAAYVVHETNGNIEDARQYAIEVSMLIGFIRGRCKDERSDDCVLLHEILQCVFGRDVRRLEFLQVQWAKFRKGLPWAVTTKPKLRSVK